MFEVQVFGITNNLLVHDSALRNAAENPLQAESKSVTKLQ